MTLRNLLVLLAFQLAGEFLHRVWHVPLSGSLLGMVLLLVALVAWGGPPESFQTTTRPLLANLALLFVPAGVGVITHLELLQSYWLAILVATLGGAIASILAGAWTMLLVERLMRKRLPLENPVLSETPTLGQTVPATALHGRPV